MFAGGHQPDPNYFTVFTTLFGYALLSLLGHIRDFFGKLTGRSRYWGRAARHVKHGHPDLVAGWESFFSRRIQHRIRDCWNRPICSAPTARGMQVMRRVTRDGWATCEVLEENPITCVNLSSYNYLGFADDWHSSCRKDVMKVVDAYPLSVCGAMGEGRMLGMHQQLERKIASFVGKEDAVIFNMVSHAPASAVAHDACPQAVPLAVRRCLLRLPLCVCAAV